MSKFLKRLFIFIFIPTAMILVLSLAVPPTPRARTSLLFSKFDKDHLLEITPFPRLILIGGSNLPYGLDSSIIEEELNLHPIDTAIHINLGAKYILDNSLAYIQPGDVILVSLEYQQFFGNEIWGGEELLRMVLDVDRSSIIALNLRQWLNIVKYLPDYSLSKIKPSEYNYKKDPYIGIYDRESFNEYGDAYIHWTRDPVEFEPFAEISGSYNKRLVEMLVTFERELHQRGAEFYFVYPVLQASSFNNLKPWIAEVEGKLTKSGLTTLGTAERYRLDDHYFLDTPYHLTREGVLYRTELIIEDLKSQDLFSYH